MIKNLLLISIYSISVFAKRYSQEELKAHGVSTKEDMPYCEALADFVLPYDSKFGALECDYATRVKKLCDQNPNAKWQFGRCFCPETNKYFDRHPARGYFQRRSRIDDRGALEQINNLEAQIMGCKAFTKRILPFGRSVFLKPEPQFFIVYKMNTDSAWSNNDDLPGPQGHCAYAPRVASMLKLPLGFGFLEDQPVIPTFETLDKNLKQINADVGFFEVHQELNTQQYLEKFIKGFLPISLIDESKDATFFLHDMNYHVLGHFLIPRAIMELAQRQTHYLLDFIKFFSTKFPELASAYPYNLMLKKLIEYQAQTIDVGSGNIILELHSIEKLSHSLDDFIRIITESRKKIKLHKHLMAITIPANSKETTSVEEFLNGQKDLILDLFEEEPAACSTFFQFLNTYIAAKKKYDPRFNIVLEVDKYNRNSKRMSGKHGRSAVDLFLERLDTLHKTGKIKQSTQTKGEQKE